MSRQNYYAKRRRRRRREATGHVVAELVVKERQLQPRLGTRKLHVLLKEQLAQAGVRIGRDRMFEELRLRQLLVKKKRAPYPRTTDARHSLPVFTNLVKDRPVKKANQVWAADLTYVRTADSFLYLALVTDQSSRKIVGYHCGDTLEAIGCIRALEMALQHLPEGAKPIHHSDRGSQYCCHEYVQRLRDRGMAVSMTQTNHSAENALAERVNGILKGEYGLGEKFESVEQTMKAVHQAVALYNTRRPHTALGYRTPSQVHSLCV